MPLDPTRPLIYLVTQGATTTSTNPESPEFTAVLRLVESAVESQISLIQLREKNLTAKVLFELCQGAVRLTRGSNTRLLVNDRFDVALAANADGVQLTSRAVPANVVRKQCGAGFLIGVSTHSLAEASLARQRGADFVLFGPVFDTESKRVFGPPQGTDKLKEVAAALKPFPIIAIGGVSVENVKECLLAGASGVAAISLFASHISQRVRAVRGAVEE